MLDNFLVLGAGSAGLLAAMTIKRMMPNAKVRVLRSPEIGVIGVGESTTPNVPGHIFQFLGIPERPFYAMVEPIWKMGIRFLWGPRREFLYTFEIQLDARFSELPRPNGYYCDNDLANISLQNALTLQNKVFPRQPSGGGPIIPGGYAFNVENVKLVNGLEVFTRHFGVEIIDGRMQGAERGPNGIAALVLEDGSRMEADFFIDCSGFRSELLGRVLEESFISYRSSLFNDRAILASWPRKDEPIPPVITAETMDAGWSWRIDHEHVINRGYVHCSSAISDEDARAEFARKNPKAKLADRIVKFDCGRYRRAWVDNVLAIGNSCGFVEPLESTSLMIICWQLQTFVELVHLCGVTPKTRDLFNRKSGETWDEVRDFLALHFWGNSLLDTPYWRQCRADTDLAGLKPLLDFYQEVGPTGYGRYFLNNTGSQFGIEGFLVMLVGMQIPYQNRHDPITAELEFISARRAQFNAQATHGMDTSEALAWIRHPRWKWHSEMPVAHR